MLGFITWTWNPELLTLGSASIRWYGLMWAIGLMLGYFVENKIYNNEKLPEGSMDRCFLVMVISTIVGARVGHCFFYEWDYFSQHLGEVLCIWKGGLSSHGGAFGILIALFFFSKFSLHKSYMWTLDRIVLAVAICGACIRLGNLFNHEIYGDPTSMPWAFSFMLHPLNAAGHQTGMSEPSHPTQIYEILYCLITFAVLMFLYWKTKASQYTGLLFSVFLMGVFLSRYLLEFIKRPQEDFEQDLLLNVGQCLSLPFVIAGAAIILYLLFKWGRTAPENQTKSYAFMAGFFVVLVAVMALPLMNKRSQLAQMKKDADKQMPEMAAPVLPEEPQLRALLAQTTFVSEEGNQINFTKDGIVLQGKTIAHSFDVKKAYSRNGYYLSADGVAENSVYRYFLCMYADGKGVLLNLKDTRGSYTTGK